MTGEQIHAAIRRKHLTDFNDTAVRVSVARLSDLDLQRLGWCISDLTEAFDTLLLDLVCDEHKARDLGHLGDRGETA